MDTFFINLKKGLQIKKRNFINTSGLKRTLYDNPVNTEASWGKSKPVTMENSSANLSLDGARMLLTNKIR
ncbi:MAG: hypothetical protein K0R50_945 [Eubacterium sp.]|jgi:hypothetical protein|nr:hypothetical protein [Eubacterium sp.]